MVQAALGDVMQQKSGSVTYQKVDDAYFEARGLKRHAGVWLLWALGVGAVISGHFSGWNLGLASGGWGGMLVATILIAIMYLGLTFSLAEMSPAMPHTGGAYSFARTAFGPWGGFLTGLAENVEYVMTAAVIVFFIGTYGAAIVGAPVEMQPLFWVAGYVLFVGLNYLGVEQSLKFSLIITVLALLCLAVFYVSAIGHIDFSTAGRSTSRRTAPSCPKATARCSPSASTACLRPCRSPSGCSSPSSSSRLAAEESVDPKRDMPKGIMLGMFTLMVSAFCVLFLNPSVIGVGSFKLGTSGEPLLDGFRAIYGEGFANALALVAVTGLVASFHAIIFAYGRQIYSLSRAGYFPRALSVTHGTRKTPHIAMVVGALLGLAVMLTVWFVEGADQGAKVIGGTLLNMAVFGAMFSYVMQGLTYIQLKRKFPHIDRPYKSPLGNVGAALTVIIALITITMQLQDPVYVTGVLWVAAWFAVGIVYFALIGRHKLILSPEEEFAMARGEAAYKAA